MSGLLENEGRCESSASSSAASSYTSKRTDTTWRYSVFGPERLGRGAMLFTGPDGIRDHRVSVEPEHRYVGDGSMSIEGTSDVDYLWRPPTSMPHPKPKTGCVGEIGWAIPHYQDWSMPLSGMQVTLGEFRQGVEDRHTHTFQNAWYPGPDDHFNGDSDAALVMNIYRKGSPRSPPNTAPGPSILRGQSSANPVNSPSTGVRFQESGKPRSPSQRSSVTSQHSTSNQ